MHKVQQMLHRTKFASEGSVFHIIMIIFACIEQNLSNRPNNLRPHEEDLFIISYNHIFICAPVLMP